MKSWWGGYLAGDAGPAYLLKVYFDSWEHYRDCASFFNNCTKTSRLDMPSASGILRYGPQSPSLSRKGWWMLVECDSDWFRLYGPWAHRTLQPQWIHAVDRDRIFDSRRVDREPRLAIMRPTILEPAWSPHISVCRNERPRTHRDMWIRATEIGDLLSRRDWLRSQDRSTHRVERALRDQRRDWLLDARVHEIPESMAPGSLVEFDYEVEARTNGHHWWFSVTCPLLSDLRETYGLPHRPRLPFHLTFAVLEGSDTD